MVGLRDRQLYLRFVGGLLFSHRKLANICVFLLFFLFNWRLLLNRLLFFFGLLWTLALVLVDRNEGIQDILYVKSSFCDFHIVTASHDFALF